MHYNKMEIHKVKFMTLVYETKPIYTQHILQCCNSRYILRPFLCNMIFRILCILVYITQYTLRTPLQPHSILHVATLHNIIVIITFDDDVVTYA